jgi:uncharacterized protein (TIGR01777 family)
MKKRIVLTGATGLIGSHIFNALVERGDEVTVFSRSLTKAKAELPGAAEYVRWTPHDSGIWEKSINGKDAIIHLVGASLAGKRWSENYKKEILNSRVLSTRGLVHAIGKSETKPGVFVCSSAIGYYGSSDYREFTEEDMPGYDFVAGVCAAWEKEASVVEEFGVRWVSIRTGIVLDKNEGALAKMLLPFRLFTGGPLGQGTQWMSWIHIDDITKIYLRAVDDPQLTGPVNASSPNPVQMNELASAIGKALNRPSWMRVPGFALKILLGEMSETVLTGQKVVPEKLIELGYNFSYANLNKALKDLLR